MRSALDIALERFGGADEDGDRLSSEQKAKLKEIQAKYDAKVAETQIVMDQEIAQAKTSEDASGVPELEERKADEIASRKGALGLRQLRSLSSIWGNHLTHWNDCLFV